MIRDVAQQHLEKPQIAHPPASQPINKKLFLVDSTGILLMISEYIAIYVSSIHPSKKLIWMVGKPNYDIYSPCFRLVLFSLVGRQLWFVHLIFSTCWKWHFYWNLLIMKEKGKADLTTVLNILGNKNLLIISDYTFVKRFVAEILIYFKTLWEIQESFLPFSFSSPAQISIPFPPSN